MNATQPVSVTNVTQAAAATVKAIAGEFYGIVVLSSTAGTVTVYDNTAASGKVLFTKAALAAGEVIHFGGCGLKAAVGLHVVVGGTASVNVMHV